MKKELPFHVQPSDPLSLLVLQVSSNEFPTRSPRTIKRDFMAFDQLVKD